MLVSKLQSDDGLLVVAGEEKNKTHLGLKSSERIFLMTCLRGHSSSIYNLAMTAFFFSQTSEDIEVFILRIGKIGDARCWHCIQSTIEDYCN